MTALYFLIAAAATTAGSMTGMGGGVIIKPIMDLLGHYDVASINMLSCIAVLAMSAVSAAKQIQQRTKVQACIAMPLAAGAVVGGNVGQWVLQALIRGAGAQNIVTAVQNIVLAALIIMVIAYMRNKHRISALGLSGIWPSLLTGFVLGVLSSFLGIGGGPINVALLIYVFSFDTRTATVNSIIIILFSQLAKFVSVLATTGFAPYNLSMLVPMVAGAIIGGFCGPVISRRLSEKHLDTVFNAVQILVLATCFINIASR